MATSVEHVMGMAVSIDIRDPQPDPAAVAAFVDWLHVVDRTFSTYVMDSEVSRFGRHEIGIDALSPDVEEVLLTCIELTDRTNGAFDAFAVPAPTTTLDPSGYVKGWAIERGATILERAGATNFCVNAGGDVLLRGRPTPTAPWSVGIRHPDQPGMLALAIRVEGRGAVATSATYERGAHIVDPRLGAPAIDIASATVVGPDLGRADALATAVFVMGIDGLEWIEGEPGYDAYIITRDDRTCWSTGFPHPISAR